jgi:O-antigen/teichoic acid export membrane protein
LVAIITPIVILSIGFRGVLEAHQRFGIINAVRINMGIFSFLGPLLVLPFSQSLLAIIAVLAVGRVVECLLMFMICVRLTPELRRGIVIQWGVVWSLLRYGGWVTISSTLGPIMIYCDRFLIGILISMAAVAYYVTPYELVTKLWFIPNAMTGVLFPAFSVSYHRDANRAGKLFSFGLRCLFLAFFPIALLITSLGQEGLNLWLGKEFAMRSTRVLQWLTIAVFVNSMAHIPFALIQGAGRPDLTAKLHLLEVPFYLIAVWLMIGAYGIEGAAIVWFGRALIDTLILLKIAGWLLPKTSHFIRQTSITMCVAILTLAVPMLHIERFTRMIFPFMALPIFAFFMWFYFLEPEERVFTQNFLGGQIRIVNNWIGKK